MTRHRSRPDRIDEILEAAAQELRSRGYAGLTMDAIARRTSLSKAGVYRFFSNKTAVALELFRRALRDVYQVDVAEALAWNLPVQETILDLLFSEGKIFDNEPRRRVWFQLVLEAVNDESFRRAKNRELRKLHLHWIELLWKLAERDAIQLKPSIIDKLKLVLETAETFLVGLSLRSLSGADVKALKAQFKLFLELMIKDVVDNEVVPAARAGETP